MFRSLVLVAVVAASQPVVAADTAAVAVPLATAVDSQASSGGSPSPGGGEPIDRELLATREAAWRAWFAGDSATLGAMLPAEFLGYGMTGVEVSDRARTLTASRGFAAAGGRLERLAFPETRAQQYGDAVVLYSLYEITLVDGAGKASTMRGRATEVFVRRDGRWLHPGWHLDLEGSGG